MIRDATPDDAPVIAAIYNHYILHTIITFEEQTVTAEEMLRRIEGVTTRLPWLVVEEGGEVVGYVYAAPWHPRAAYRHSVEISAYLAHGQSGKGHGTKLYEVLLERLPGLGVHAVMAGVALPNAASVALLEKFGFEKAAHYREVGRKFGQWIDVGYWQLIYPNDTATESTTNA